MPPPEPADSGEEEEGRGMAYFEGSFGKGRRRAR